jgi:Sortilin, neurotensin receptor 3,
MDNQRGVVYSLAISPRNDAILWAGTDDGLVWRTQDGGKNWSNITPQGISAWSKVTQIDASHFDDNTAYVSVSRFRIDDPRPYIFRTRDGGKTWESITAGLPSDEPVNTVREDPQRKGLLFAGTEKSVWMSADDGDHWGSLQINLPHTSMRDLWIHDNDLILGTHGRSIWILDDISPLRQLAGTVLREPVLVRPAAAYRIPQSTWTDTPIPPDEPLASNPPSGAVIDYFLPRDAKRPVTLEIRDAKGNLVRRFASNDPRSPTGEELARELIPAYWIATTTPLPATAGMHRWIWNLHYPDPQTLTRGYPISAVPHATSPEPEGPAVLPGNYVVRLTVDGRRLEAPLVVRSDPRVSVSADALEAQFELASRLAQLMNESARTVLSAQSEHSQLQAVLGKHPGEPVASYDKKLTEFQEPASEVQGQVETLYKEIVRADAAPTAAQTKAWEVLETKLTQTLASWNQLQKELPALNEQLRKARLPAIHPELPPPRDLNVADEE